MTCYEHIRKKKTAKKESNHTKGYLFALENDQLEIYHKNHGRGLV